MYLQNSSMLHEGRLVVWYSTQQGTTHFRFFPLFLIEADLHSAALIFTLPESKESYRLCFATSSQFHHAARHHCLGVFAYLQSPPESFWEAFQPTEKKILDVIFVVQISILGASLTESCILEVFVEVLMAWRRDESAAV